MRGLSGVRLLSGVRRRFLYDASLRRLAVGIIRGLDGERGTAGTGKGRRTMVENAPLEGIAQKFL